MRNKYIDWSEYHEDINFECPYCNGTKHKAWDKLEEDEKNMVKDTCEEYKEWHDLNIEEKTIVTDTFCNTEDRNESDKVCPKDEDVIGYYETTLKASSFSRKMHWQTFMTTIKKTSIFIAKNVKTVSSHQ